MAQAIPWIISAIGVGVSIYSAIKEGENNAAQLAQNTAANNLAALQTKVKTQQDIINDARRQGTLNQQYTVSIMPGTGIITIFGTDGQPYRMDDATGNLINAQGKVVNFNPLTSAKIEPSISPDTVNQPSVSPDVATEETAAKETKALQEKLEADETVKKAAAAASAAEIVSTKVNTDGSVTTTTRDGHTALVYPNGSTIFQDPNGSIYEPPVGSELAKAAAAKAELFKRHAGDIEQLTKFQGQDKAQLIAAQKEDLAKVKARNVSDLSAFGSKQALEETQATQGEQNALVSANIQMRAGQEQIGTQKYAAAVGSSVLVANAAKRGIAITSPLMQLQVYKYNTEQQITKGEANLEDVNALATTEIAQGAANFERARNLQHAAFTTEIARNEEDLATSMERRLAALELGQTQQKEGMTLQQKQELDALNLGIASSWGEIQLGNQAGISSANLEYQGILQRNKQAEIFGEANLASYNSSMWLNTFSSILSDTASVLGRFNVQTYENPVSSDRPQRTKKAAGW